MDNDLAASRRPVRTDAARRRPRRGGRAFFWFFTEVRGAGTKKERRIRVKMFVRTDIQPGNHRSHVRW